MITEGVTPSLHVDYKHTRIKQYHKQGRALRTETTINDTTDFSIGKRLTNLPALREIGFSANRRLLRVEPCRHNRFGGLTPTTDHNTPNLTHNSGFTGSSSASFAWSGRNSWSDQLLSL